MCVCVSFAVKKTPRHSLNINYSMELGSTLDYYCRSGPSPLSLPTPAPVGAAPLPRCGTRTWSSESGKKKQAKHKLKTIINGLLSIKSINT